MTAKIYLLPHAYMLPGHVHGQRELISQLQGDSNKPVVVAGHYYYDTFVVDDYLAVECCDGEYCFGNHDDGVEYANKSLRKTLDEAFGVMCQRYPTASYNDLAVSKSLLEVSC